MSSRHSVLIASVFVAAMTTSGSADASAWTQQESGYYFTARARAIIGGKGYFADGMVRDLDQKFQDLRLNLYGEYGLTDDITAIVSATPFGRTTVGKGSLYFIADHSAELRYALSKGSIPVSVQASYGHTGARLSGQPPVSTSGHTWIYDPVTPSHFGAVSSHIGYGGSFGWVNAGLGVRGYSSPKLDPSIFGILRTGTNLGPVGVSATLIRQHSTGKIVIDNIGGGGPTSFLGFAIGADYWFTQYLGAGVGIEGAAMARANAAAPVFTVSMNVKGP